MQGNLVDNISTIVVSSTTLLTLGGVILLVVALLRMKKSYIQRQDDGLYRTCSRSVRHPARF